MVALKVNPLTLSLQLPQFDANPDKTVKPLTAVAPETGKAADRDSTRNTKSCYTP